ncbi:MAG TPA: anti-sigma factor [Gemmatimonadales bacterium]|nr:anti-sigma factor [Gemmatimonadales bacterium]
MSDQYTNRLSEYLDDELDPASRVEMDAHLAACGECRATLAELKGVVARAQRLDERGAAPAADLWPRIADRIGLATDDLARRRAARRFSFSVPQLVAASFILAVVSGGAAWLARSWTGGAKPPVAAGPSLGGAGVGAAVVSWVPKADSSADHAVADLRLALAEGRQAGRIDSATVATLEHSLAVIDSAITEARVALAQDPNSPYLNHHLAATMRRKFEFLRQAGTIASARS